MASSQIQDYCADGANNSDLIDLQDEQDLAGAQVTGHEFAIDNEQAANWLARRIKHEREYAQRVGAWAASEIQMAERREKHLLQRFGRQLEDWLRHRLSDDGGRRRSVNLPAGTIGFRQQPLSLCVSESEEVWNWCRRKLVDAVKLEIAAEGQDAIRLNDLLQSMPLQVTAFKTIRKRVLSEHLTQTGEAADGVTVTGGGERFFIK